MPTRILVWNIQSFGINKFNNPYANRVGAGMGGLTLQQASVQRRQILANVLLATTPDILVVVEVSSGDSYPNSLASLTGGMSGCVDLLTRLRGTPALGGNSWRLVPPLRIGRGGIAESMGVFYRGQTGVDGAAVHRYFTGPNRWNGGYAGPSVRPGAAVPNAYPAVVVGSPDLRAMITPPGTALRNIPAAALHNGGLPENQVAARTQFQFANFTNTGPAGNIDYQQFREPYMATFTETNAAGAVQRNISVFGIHSPAVTGNQQVFITYLSLTYEISSALGANETRVLCGDFNLNLLDANGNNANQYVGVTALGYNPVLNPAGGPPVNLDAYKGYFATHIKRAPTQRTAASKFLWSQNGGNQAFYPGYEYIGSRFVQDFYSIDNMLVRPAAGAPATTIMNPVMGTPFNGVAAPVPGNPPIGTLPMGNNFNNVPMGMVWPQQPTANNYPGIGGANRLCGWDNYGRIYSTSDHFALYAAV